MLQQINRELPLLVELRALPDQFGLPVDTCRIDACKRGRRSSIVYLQITQGFRPGGLVCVAFFLQN